MNAKNSNYSKKFDTKVQSISRQMIVNGFENYNEINAKTSNYSETFYTKV